MTSALASEVKPVVMTTRASNLGSLIRSWRTARGKSQLALAGEANISARHLSFLETGRAKPSREMVLTLAESLDVPLRERNTLLTAAGFAPVFQETPLDAAAMSEVRDALRHILHAHEPNPALLVNRRYDILLANQGAVELLSFFAPKWQGKNNIARMLFSTEGLRPAVVNWVEVASHVERRIRAELTAGARDALDEEMLALALQTHREVAHVPIQMPSERSLILPVTLRKRACVVNLFTTISTLGTPLDITLQELRIETFFAADATSRAALERIVRRASGAPRV